MINLLIFIEFVDIRGLNFEFSAPSPPKSSCKRKNSKVTKSSSSNLILSQFETPTNFPTLLCPPIFKKSEEPPEKKIKDALESTNLPKTPSKRRSQRISHRFGSESSSQRLKKNDDVIKPDTTSSTR